MTPFLLPGPAHPKERSMHSGRKQAAIFLSIYCSSRSRMLTAIPTLEPFICLEGHPHGLLSCWDMKRVSLIHHVFAWGSPNAPGALGGCRTATRSGGLTLCWSGSHAPRPRYRSSGLGTSRWGGQVSLLVLGLAARVERTWG